MLFANQSEADVIYKAHLDELAAKHPDNFKIFYVIDKATTKEWKGGVGYITKDMLAAHLPPPTNKDGMVLVCGPPGMMKFISGDKVGGRGEGGALPVSQPAGWRHGVLSLSLTQCAHTADHLPPPHQAPDKSQGPLAGMLKDMGYTEAQVFKF